MVLLLCLMLVQITGVRSSPPKTTLSLVERRLIELVAELTPADPTSDRKGRIRVCPVQIRDVT